jgi:hypothetical protein
MQNKPSGWYVDPSNIEYARWYNEASGWCAQARPLADKKEGDLLIFANKLGRNIATYFLSIMVIVIGVVVFSEAESLGIKIFSVLATIGFIIFAVLMHKFGNRADTQYKTLLNAYQAGEIDLDEIEDITLEEKNELIKRTKKYNIWVSVVSATLSTVVTFKVGNRL